MEAHGGLAWPGKVQGNPWPEASPEQVGEGQVRSAASSWASSLGPRKWGAAWVSPPPCSLGLSVLWDPLPKGR